MSDRNYSRRLKTLRTTIGIGQRQMALFFNVAVGTYSEWETGKTKIHGSAVILLKILFHDFSVAQKVVEKKSMGDFAKPKRLQVVSSELWVHLKRLLELNVQHPHRQNWTKWIQTPGEKFKGPVHKKNYWIKYGQLLCGTPVVPGKKKPDSRPFLKSLTI